ncbi:JAB domain-containing protein [Vibrio agarivorans]|nr:JAB domain-containing protein [Vibrio agarivorans]MDN3660447.1 JAB domain-containing protein [Vibrio agarivorans]
MKLAHHDKEVFGIILLDNQNQLICFEQLFTGTIALLISIPERLLKLALELMRCYGHWPPISSTRTFPIRQTNYNTLM